MLTSQNDQLEDGSFPSSPLLGTQAVEIDDHDDQDTRDNALPKCIDVQQIGAVVDRRKDKGTQQRAVHRANRAKEACATDHRRSDRLQFPALRLRRVADSNAGGEQDAHERGADRREDIGDINHPRRVNAGKARCLRYSSQSRTDIVRTGFDAEKCRRERRPR